MTVATKIGFIGAGNMATALIRGIVAARDGDGSQLAATDVDVAKTQLLRDELNIQVCEDASALCQWADVVILAVKPQVIERVLDSCHDHLGPKHLVISVAGGIRTKAIATALETGVRILRAMPNTPALVGAGATALSAGPLASKEDMATAHGIFASVGRVVTVAESAMDAVTGLSGSGPAYVFMAIEAMADGGVRAGLARDVALELAAQTVFGAAKLVLETGEHPAKLKDMVTSPGGTTIAGVSALEREGLRHALMSAVEAAAARSKELGG
jgi:pyrroline-5-carboxylate reductase